MIISYVSLELLIQQLNFQNEKEIQNILSTKKSKKNNFQLCSNSIFSKYPYNKHLRCSKPFSINIYSNTSDEEDFDETEIGPFSDQSDSQRTNDDKLFKENSKTHELSSDDTFSNDDLSDTFRPLQTAQIEKNYPKNKQHHLSEKSQNNKDYLTTNPKEVQKLIRKSKKLQNFSKKNIQQQAYPRGKTLQITNVPNPLYFSNEKEMTKIENSIEDVKEKIETNFDQMSSNSKELRAFLSEEASYMNRAITDFQMKRLEISQTFHQVLLDLDKSFQKSINQNTQRNDLMNTVPIKSPPLYRTPQPKHKNFDYFADDSNSQSEEEAQSEEDFSEISKHQYKKSKHQSKKSKAQKGKTINRKSKTSHPFSTQNSPLIRSSTRNQRNGKERKNINDEYDFDNSQLIISENSPADTMIQQLKQNVKVIQKKLHEDFIRRRLDLDLMDD